MKLEVAEYSHIGVREQNEDFCTHLLMDELAVFVVADGMGGHEGGEIASRYFCDELLKNIRASNPEKLRLSEDTITNHILEGTSSMCTRIRAEHPNLDPHTTCVITWITDSELFCSHVGDSRMYLLDKNEIIWQSRDHSIAQLMVDQGEIIKEEVSEHDSQSVLYRSIGCEKTPQPSVTKLDRLENNQAIVLCSDGLWQYVDEKELSSLSNSRNLKKSLRKLVQMAVNRAAGSSDNVTAQVIRRPRRLLKNFFSRAY